MRRDVNPDDIPDHELANIFIRLAWKDDFKYANKTIRQFGKRYLSLDWLDRATEAGPDSAENVEDFYASPTESEDEK